MIQWSSPIIKMLRIIAIEENNLKHGVFIKYQEHIILNGKTVQWI